MSRRQYGFLLYTAAFAALAAWVFAGTWSLDACPVMPDAAMAFPEGPAWRAFLRDWRATGKFTLFDIRHFIGTGYLWQELQYAVPAWLSGIGLAYWLRGRGVARAAAWGAGLLLGFSGYWLTLFSAGHVGWFMWMSAGVFPFGLIDRAVRKNKFKNWLLAGACEAWACFYQPDMWLLFAAFAGAYFVWCCIRERKLPGFKGVAVAVAAFLAIGAPGIRTALTGDLAARDRQIEESKGTALAPDGGDGDEARWIFATNWSLPPAETLEFAIPRLNGDTSCPATLALGRRQGTGVEPYTGALGRPYGAESGNYRQHSLYAGFATCLLAVFALAAAVRRKESPFRREIFFLSGAAFVFWLFSLGRYCEPVYRVVYALPFGEYLRAPVKWHHLTELCLCALAGYGLQSLYAKLRGAGAAVARFAAPAAAALAFAGAADLARVDRLYCAAVDLAPVKGENAAAADMAALGGGRLLELVEGGHWLMAESFKTKGVEIAGDGPGGSDARFVFAPAGGPGVARLEPWLKARKARLAGTYVLSPRGVRKAGAGRPADFALWELPGVPPPGKNGDAPRAGAVPLCFGTVSLAATLFAVVCAAAGSRRRGVAHDKVPEDAA